MDSIVKPKSYRQHSIKMSRWQVVYSCTLKVGEF